MCDEFFSGGVMIQRRSGRKIQASNQLHESLHRVILLKETGPKSAAWQRARVQALWRLHRLLEQQDTPPASTTEQSEPRR